MNSLSERTKDSGFSLIELMVVVGILSILILIAVASFSYSSRTAARTTCDHNRASFETAATMYRNDHDSDPSNLDDLEPYIANFDSANVCPGNGETLLRYDTTSNEIVCDYHQ